MPLQFCRAPHLCCSPVQDWWALCCDVTGPRPIMPPPSKAHNKYTPSQRPRHSPGQPPHTHSHAHTEGINYRCTLNYFHLLPFSRDGTHTAWWLMKQYFNTSLSNMRAEQAHTHTHSWTLMLLILFAALCLFFSFTRSRWMLFISSVIFYRSAEACEDYSKSKCWSRHGSRIEKHLCSNFFPAL